VAIVDYQGLMSPFFQVDCGGVIFNRDIGRPQREFLRLEESRNIPGNILDVGCQEKKVFINFPLR